ncbi:hypothetical protein EV361DRAFT_588665 [Lentinula raphanica]|nr:hypothetical protein EV361DRAFT_588665 [Lentinula raphanica]
MREELQKKRQQSGTDTETAADENEDALLERVVVLLRDVDTRWSSTFFMVDRFLELYPVSESALNGISLIIQIGHRTVHYQ